MLKEDKEILDRKLIKLENQFGFSWKFLQKVCQMQHVTGKVQM
jgi:hypothetical protein